MERYQQQKLKRFTAAELIKIGVSTTNIDVVTPVSLLVLPDTKMNVGSMRYSSANEERSIQQGIPYPDICDLETFHQRPVNREQSSGRLIS